MKRYILLALGFLILVPFTFAELKKAQMWAISLTGILSEIHGSNRNSLNVTEMNEDGKKTYLETLRRDWSITTKEGLLETLKNLEAAGHTASLREIQKIRHEIIATKNESDLKTIFEKYKWDTTTFNRYKYISTNWEKYNNRTIRAWDLGRGISLCRWGYTVGFLTEEEAWGKIFHLANIIQPLYKSWEDYGYDYFIGRLFWSSGFGEEETYLANTEPVYQKLLNSYWNWIEWDIDLNLPETKEMPINIIRFLKPNDDDGILQFHTNDPAMYDRWFWNYRVNPNINQNIYEFSVKKKSGNNTSGFGILFCVDDSDTSNANYYRFLVTVDGRYTIQKRFNNIWATAPLSWRDSSSLNKGYNVYNKLKIERIDEKNHTTFNVFINDNLISSYGDDKPINGNKIGLALSISVKEKEQFPHIPVDVRFDFQGNSINSSSLVKLASP